MPAKRECASTKTVSMVYHVASNNSPYRHEGAIEGSECSYCALIMKPERKAGGKNGIDHRE